MSLKSLKFAFRAEFYDVDSMNVVWHGNYVRYLEFGRCRFLDAAKFNYETMKNAGFALPIVKMNLKYIKPIFFNDECEICVSLKGFEGFLNFDYEIFARNEKVCKASTAQMAVNLQGESLFELPQNFVKVLQDFIKNGG